MNIRGINIFEYTLFVPNYILLKKFH